jgi:hypothetical protein
MSLLRRDHLFSVNSILAHSVTAVVRGADTLRDLDGGRLVAGGKNEVIYQARKAPVHRDRRSQVNWANVWIDPKIELSFWNNIFTWNAPETNQCKTDQS